MAVLDKASSSQPPPPPSSSDQPTSNSTNRSNHHHHTHTRRHHHPHHPPTSALQQRGHRQSHIAYNVLWGLLSTLLVTALYFWYDERTRIRGPLEEETRHDIRALMSRTTRRMRLGGSRSSSSSSNKGGSMVGRRRAARGGGGKATVVGHDDGAAAVGLEKTLVIYNVHHDTTPLDNLHRENLDFFLEAGVGWEPDMLVDYLFLVPPAPVQVSRKTMTSVERKRQQQQQQEQSLASSNKKKAKKERESPVARRATSTLPYKKPVFPRVSNLRVMEVPQDCLGCSGLRSLLPEGPATPLTSLKNETHTNTTLQQSEVADTQGRMRKEQQEKETSKAALTSFLTWEELEQYSYFIFLDSSMRGPFLPRYMHRPRSRTERWEAPQWTKPWTTVFTDRLDERVKLVGRTVSCEVQMHVQAPLWATDRVGLRLLLDAGVLDCARTMTKALHEYELAATTTIFDAGYGIDSLMLRYQGLDLAKIRDMPCTARNNPSVPFLNDGLPINPLEVVFVVTTPQLLASDPILRRYTDYFLGRVSVKENDFYSERVQAAVEARRQRLVRMVADCGATLDRDHLVPRCPDCGEIPPHELQERFLGELVLDGYDYRFTVEETDVEKLPYHYCEPFLRYQAADLSS